MQKTAPQRRGNKPLHGAGTGDSSLGAFPGAMMLSLLTCLLLLLQSFRPSLPQLLSLCSTAFHSSLLTMCSFLFYSPAASETL